MLCGLVVYIQNLERHDFHYNLVTNFKLPFGGLLQGSANGFIFLRDLCATPNSLFICNPITREYVEVHCPQEFVYTYPQVVTFGFGVSKITNQYKVVRVFHDHVHDQESNKWSVTKCESQVYTLGTGSWRRIAPSAPFAYNCRSIGAFFEGSLHWLVSDSNYKPLISCLDVETELFSAISLPSDFVAQEKRLAGVFALDDCLCLCDNSSDNEIVIWLMKEYGVEKSWTKEFVIQKPDVEISSYDPYQVVSPIKVFEDGDILMAWGDFFIFYSSKETRNIIEIDMFKARSWGAIESILHKSSFVSLKSFGMEHMFHYLISS